MLRRGLKGAIAAVATASGVVVAAAVSNNGGVTYQQPYDASIYADHFLPPSGVGGTCGDDQGCRSGLACSGDGTCEPAHSTPTGSTCVIDDECIAGDYCGGTHECDPTTVADGGGAAGSTCSNDGDCVSGLRCDP